MRRIVLGISFLVAGCLPMVVGGYAAWQEDYITSIGCFLVAVCGFQQVYHHMERSRLHGEIGRLNGQIAKQKGDLTKANRLIEQKNKEIWAMKNMD